MLSLIAYVLLGIAAGSAIASRLGDFRWGSVILALPSALAITAAMFLGDAWGPWIFALLAAATAWAVVVIVLNSQLTDAVKLDAIVVRVGLIAFSLLVAGFCRLGGALDPELIGGAVTLLGGATALVVGWDFSDSPGLSHVDYRGSRGDDLVRARRAQRVIWWKIISAGVILIAILLIIVAPEAQSTALSHPVVVAVLGAGAVMATIAGLVRVRALTHIEPDRSTRFGDVALLAVGNLFAVALASSPFWTGGMPFIIGWAALIIAILLALWFAIEVIANAALNAVPLAAGAMIAVVAISLTPTAVLLALATPSAEAPSPPTTLDLLVIGSVGATVSISSLTGIGRLVSRWPSRTLQPTFIALLVDSLMYWWLVIAAGLVLNIGPSIKDAWIVSVLLAAVVALIVEVIRRNDVQHYADQATRTRDPQRWSFGDDAGRSFRRVLGLHLASQWGIGVLIVIVSALGAVGILGTAQLLS
jgi:hypothetical protein